MENIVKKWEEQCTHTLVETLGMEFTGYGEGWMTMKMPVDHRTCRPDGALHGGANMALAETVSGALSSVSVPYGNAVSGIWNRDKRESCQKGRRGLRHCPCGIHS